MLRMKTPEQNMVMSLTWNLKRGNEHALQDNLNVPELHEHECDICLHTT